tara:strand:- start:11762 stop:12610 length:849 start_codon:yes stop_codon:yes gene_type:complete
MIGVATFAYLINDFFDKKIDESSNKINIFRKINSKYFIPLIIISLFIIISPWRILPGDIISFILLSLLLILFIIYSAPVTRLKNKGIGGIILDALYAYGLSSLLTLYTFIIMLNSINNPDYFILYIIFIWQFLIGIRSIIFHQITDYKNDLEFNRTWTVKVGIKKSKKLIKIYLLPFEFIMLLGSLIIISQYFILIIPFSILFWINVLLKYKNYYKHPEKIDFKQFIYTFLDDYYYQCFPVLILIFMSTTNPNYILLLLIHLLLFKNIIFNYLRYLKIYIVK